jgi:hypothetical protein
MRAVAAGLAYVALVFGVGFVLGVARVTLLVPRLGERTAELIELPVMVLVCVLAARFVVRRFCPLGMRQRIGMGGLALAVLVGAELGLTLASGQSLASYFTDRDPVAGTAYAVSLVLFALMPALVGARAGPGTTRGQGPRGDADGAR